MKQDLQELALFNCQMPPPRKCCLLIRTGLSHGWVWKQIVYFFRTKCCCSSWKLSGLKLWMNARSGVRQRSAVWKLLISNPSSLEKGGQGKTTPRIHKRSKIRVQEEGWVHKSQLCESSAVGWEGGKQGQLWFCRHRSKRGSAKIFVNHLIFLLKCNKFELSELWCYKKISESNRLAKISQIAKKLLDK